MQWERAFTVDSGAPGVGRCAAVARATSAAASDGETLCEGGSEGGAGGVSGWATSGMATQEPQVTGHFLSLFGP